MNSILSVVLILSLTLASVPVTAQQPPDSRVPLQSTLLTTAQTSLLPTQLTQANAMTHDVPRTIRQSGVAAVIQEFKRDRAFVRLRLRDNSDVVGLVGHCHDERFELIQAHDEHDFVRFDQIAAFLELETGQVVSTVGQGAIGGAGKPSLRTTIIVMAAVAAALIIFWSRIPK